MRSSTRSAPARNVQRFARLATAAVIAASTLTTVAAVSSDTVTSATSNTTAFTPVGPCRLADTRNGNGVTRLSPDTVRVQVTGRCGAPTTATAATLTVTIAGATQGGFATAFPSGEPRPTTSNVNWNAGNTRANSAMVKLGAQGAVDVYIFGAADLIVDVTGTFSPASTARAGRFIPIDPLRSLDTRNTGALAPNAIVDVALPYGVPADATAVAVNVTAAGQGHAGFYTVWASGAAMPEASMLNTDSWDQTRAAASVVPVSASGLSLYSSGGGHVIVDITGYFTGPSAGGSGIGLFVPLSPTRLYDSRNTSKLSAGSSQRVGVPIVGAAIVSNWTIAQADDAGFLALRAAGTPFAATSDANAPAGDTVANMAITAVSDLGVDAYTWGGAHLIADLQGYFTGSQQEAATLPFSGTARSDGRTPGPRHSDRVYRVVYVGDSMAAGSIDSLRHALPGWELNDATDGGTAPCDWITGPRVRGMENLLETVQPDFVVISFLGNNLTPCTGYESGTPLLEQYRRDTTSLCQLVAPANCVLVGQAPLIDWGHTGGIPFGEPTPLYVELASNNPWMYVDAGSAVEDANGGYVASLRSADLVHFSPEGAARYGFAIAAFLKTITR